MSPDLPTVFLIIGMIASAFLGAGLALLVFLDLDVLADMTADRILDELDDDDLDDEVLL